MRIAARSRFRYFAAAKFRPASAILNSYCEQLHQHKLPDLDNQGASNRGDHP